MAFLPLPDQHRVDIHVLCGCGRHGSVVVAEEFALRLRAVGFGVETEHRHIDQPILESLGSHTHRP
ncbi:RNase adaptor protein for sRNA GlmZ degradation [Streptomyces sp. TE3672]